MLSLWAFPLAVVLVCSDCLYISSDLSYPEFFIFFINVISQCVYHDQLILNCLFPLQYDLLSPFNFFFAVAVIIFLYTYGINLVFVVYFLSATTKCKLE